MKKLILCSLLAISSSLFSAMPTPTAMPTPVEPYDPTRTFLVDYNAKSGNYLIRGNTPLNPDGSFAYVSLAAALAVVIGPSFDLTKYNLIDVSLIDNAGNLGDLSLEFYAYNQMTAFNAYVNQPNVWPPFKVRTSIPVTTMFGTSVAGNRGSLVWYPVQGCPGPVNCAAVEQPLFGFDQEVSFINALLTTTAKTKSVIYFHCTHGHDRTSALHAGYLMKFKGATLMTALENCPVGRKAFKNCDCSPPGAKGFKHCWEANYATLTTWYAGFLGQ